MRKSHGGVGENRNAHHETSHCLTVRTWDNYIFPGCMLKVLRFMWILFIIVISRWDHEKISSWGGWKQYCWPRDHDTSHGLTVRTWDHHIFSWLYVDSLKNFVNIIHNGHLTMRPWENLMVGWVKTERLTMRPWDISWSHCENMRSSYFFPVACW